EDRGQRTEDRRRSLVCPLSSVLCPLAGQVALERLPGAVGRGPGVPLLGRQRLQPGQGGVVGRRAEHRLVADGAVGVAGVGGAAIFAGNRSGLSRPQLSSARASSPAAYAIRPRTSSFHSNSGDPRPTAFSRSRAASSWPASYSAKASSTASKAGRSASGSRSR